VSPMEVVEAWSRTQASAESSSAGLSSGKVPEAWSPRRLSVAWCSRSLT
jgi:hypothetical protein